jgi:glyoxylase I family protein
MLEIYKRKEVQVPDYANMDPLLLHVAFICDDVTGTVRKLVAAGARMVGDITNTPEGDELAMLRDPWGFAIQLAKRAKPML